MTTDKEPALNKAAHQPGDRIRANIRTSVNSDMIRRENRDGRDVIVVKSYTLPDNIIMNSIRYPAEEIEKSYKTLEGSPAPLGHPTVASMFVSARTPLGLNLGYFGAWNANATRATAPGDPDGPRRVLLEKVIDVERANESKMGRRVLAALEEGKPIHTSTGVLMNLRECTSSDLADLEGFDMEFDHDAILLDEEGAATPDQGVGMMVNSARDEEGRKLAVVNSNITEEVDERIDDLGQEIVSLIERKETATKWEQMKSAILEALGLGRDMDEPQQRKEQLDMAEEEKKTGDDMKEVMSRIEKIEERMNAMDEYVKNMGDKTEKANAALAAIEAEQKGKRDALVNSVVEAKILTADEAKDVPSTALTALLNAAKPKEVPAPGVFGGYHAHVNNDDNVHMFDPLGSDQKKEA